MADTELKKLNKTVDEAVNILKLYVGNSAQLKQMNEKQREAISKWFDVTEKQEETIKQTRAFTERERDEKGRFLKKQEAFSWNIMGIAKSISGIFMGMAKGIGTAISGIARGVVSHLNGFFSAVKSHFLGLFGEESEWFDILRGIFDSVKGFFGWFARGFIWIFKRSPSWANSMTKTLNKMYALQVKQLKMEFLSKDKKKMTFWSVLGGLLFLGAALIGAWIRKKLMGIELILRSFKIGTLFKKIQTRWARAIAHFKRFMNFLDKVPLLGKILRGLKFGFRVLGWPLTILFGIIDFIKGWRKDTGDWQSKLMSGLREAFHGIFDFPLEILGWVWDKLMGLFGVESTGTGDKLKQWFDTAMKFIFEFGPIGIITDIIKGFTTEGGFKQVIKDKMNRIGEPIFKLIDFIANIWNGFLEWVVNKTPDIPWLKGKVINFADSMKLEAPKSPKTVEKEVVDYTKKHEMRKMGIEQENADDLKDAVKEGTEATRANSKKTEGAVQAMTAIAAGGGGQGAAVVEQKQIPDEVDNGFMTVFNYGGAMF